MKIREKEALYERATDEFIRQKMMEAADLYEEQLNSDPTLDDVEPSPELFGKILEEIRRTEAAESAEVPGIEKEADSAEHAESVEALLSEEDRKALEIGRKTLRRSSRRKIFRGMGIAAAVAIGVFAVSMSSEANRIRLLNMWNTVVGDGTILRVDNDENRVLTNDKERKAIVSVEKALGVKPPEFMYLLEGMYLDRVVVENEGKDAKLFYLCQEKVLTVDMMMEGDEISKGGTQDGEVLNTFLIDTIIGELEIAEVEAPSGKRYMTQFLYNNCYFTIYGPFSKEDFTELIKNMII